MEKLQVQSDTVLLMEPSMYLKENLLFSVPEARTTVSLRCGVTDVAMVLRQLTVPVHRCVIRSSETLHSFTAYTATVSVYLARTLCTMLMVKILQRTSAVSRKQISVPVPLLSGTIPWLPAEARFTCIRWRARQPKMIR